MWPSGFKRGSSQKGSRKHEESVGMRNYHNYVALAQRCSKQLHVERLGAESIFVRTNDCKVVPSRSVTVHHYGTSHTISIVCVYH